MFDRLLERIGDLNPQLMREIKSRVSWPSIIATIVISAILQLIPFSNLHSINFMTEFDRWQQTIEFLDRELWWGVAIGSIYLLTKDFQRELKSGTILLVNLSPTSSDRIVIGKLLGVPILIYLAVLLTLPFYLGFIIKFNSIAISFLVWKAIEILMLLLLCLYGIFCAIEFLIPPLMLSISLALFGQISLSSINSILASGDRIINIDRAYLLSGNGASIVLNLLITSFVLLKLVGYLCSSPRTWQEKDRSASAFIMSSMVLGMYVYLVGFIPIPMLILLVLMWVGVVMLRSDLPSKSD